MSDQNGSTLQIRLKQDEQTPTPSIRLGDVSAMLRVMKPLHGTGPDPVQERRRLLADLCRFIGVNVGAVDPKSWGLQSNTSASPGTNQPGDPVTAIRTEELSPRLEQTLRHLLEGDSEKQVARKLDISQHTVHVYVKALYRRFGVSTRAELLSRYLKR